MDDDEQHIRVLRTRPGTDTIDITMTGDLDAAPAFPQQVATAPNEPHSDTRDDAPEASGQPYQAQAQGMVMVQLNGDIAEALVCMRTHAYTHNRRFG